MAQSRDNPVARYWWLVLVLWIGLAAAAQWRHAPPPNAPASWADASATAPDRAAQLLRTAFPTDAWGSEIFVLAYRWNGLANDERKAFTGYVRSLSKGAPGEIMRIEPVFDGEQHHDRPETHAERLAVLRVLLRSDPHSPAARKAYLWLRDQVAAHRFNNGITVSITGDVAIITEHEQRLLARRPWVTWAGVVLLLTAGLLRWRFRPLAVVPASAAALAAVISPAVAPIVARSGSLPPLAAILAPAFAVIFTGSAAMLITAHWRRRGASSAVAGLVHLAGPILFGGLTMTVLCLSAPMWLPERTGRPLALAGIGVAVGVAVALTWPAALLRALSRFAPAAAPTERAVAVMRGEPVAAVAFLVLLAFLCALAVDRFVAVRPEAPELLYADAPALQALQRIDEHYGARAIAPTDILLEGQDWTRSEGQKQLVVIRDALLRLPNVDAVVVPLQQREQNVFTDPRARRMLMMVKQAAALNDAAVARTSRRQDEYKHTAERIGAAVDALRRLHADAAEHSDQTFLLLPAPGRQGWSGAAARLKNLSLDLLVIGAQVDRMAADDAAVLMLQQATGDMLTRALNVPAQSPGVEPPMPRIAGNGRLARISVFPAHSPLIMPTPSVDDLLDEIARARGLSRPLAAVVPRGLGWWSQALRLEVSWIVVAVTAVVAALVLVLLRWGVGHALATVAGGFAATFAATIVVVWQSDPLFGVDALADYVAPATFCLVFPLTTMFGLVAGKRTAANPLAITDMVWCGAGAAAASAALALGGAVGCRQMALTAVAGALVGAWFVWFLLATAGAIVPEAAEGESSAGTAG